MNLRRGVLNVVELERALLPPQLRGAYLVHGGASDAENAGRLKR